MTMLRRHYPLGVFLLAFGLRLALVLWMPGEPYHYSEHYTIAHNLLTGQGYRHDWYGLGAQAEGSFMPPLYVGLLVLFQVVFADYPWLALQFFQAVLSALTAVLVYFLARQFFSHAAGVLASLALAFYPPSLGYVIAVQTVVVEAFLITAFVLSAAYWQAGGRWLFAVGMGLALGLVILSRSSLILVTPIVLLWMLWARGRRGAAHFGLVMLSLAVVVAPWTIRNYGVHGKFVLVSTNGGYTIYEGNNEYATGVSYWELSDLWKQHPTLTADLMTMSETEREARLYQESLAYMRAHPDRAAQLALRKLGYFWLFRPDFAEAGVANGYPWYFSFVYMGSYLVILGLTLVSLVLIGRRKFNDLALIYALAATQTVTSMIYISGTRYRAFIEPLLIVVAAYAMLWLLRPLTQRLAVWPLFRSWPEALSG